MVNVNQKILDTLHDYRKELNMSVTRFCQLSEISRRSLQRLEKGNLPTQEMLDRIEKVLRERNIPADPVGGVHGRNTSLTERDLGLSRSDEETLRVIQEVSRRYLSELKTFTKVTVKSTRSIKNDLDNMTSILEVLIEQNAPRLPVPRQCMLFGLAQGYLGRIGVITLADALLDHDAVYFSPNHA